MQRIFAEPTPWRIPWMERVLPAIVRLVESSAERTIFTRFVPPHTPETAKGRWRIYYDRWRQMTRDHLDPDLLDLVQPLTRFVPPARVLDKAVYSAFGAAGLSEELERRGADTVVVTGGETDVCVLATVLDAVDRGFRVVIPLDGICGSADSTHDALIKLYTERFSQQIETASVEMILASWRIH